MSNLMVKNTEIFERMVEYIICRYPDTGVKTSFSEIAINFKGNIFGAEDLLKMAEHFNLALHDLDDAIIPKEDLHGDMMYAYLTYKHELILFRNPDMRTQ